MRFQAAHIKQIQEQDATRALNEFVTDADEKALENCRFAFTGFGDGKPVICAGLAEYWTNRAEAWAIVDRNSLPYFTQIHYAVKKFLEICPIRRIEAAVDVNFKAGHRWVKLLGFTLEAPVVRKYLPNGTDCSLYAKVRENG